MASFLRIRNGDFWQMGQNSKDNHKLIPPSFKKRKRKKGQILIVLTTQNHCILFLFGI